MPRPNKKKGSGDKYEDVDVKEDLKIIERLEQRITMEAPAKGVRASTCVHMYPDCFALLYRSLYVTV